MIGIIDIETTNFIDRGGFIVEVGIASAYPATGEVKAVYESVCREKGMTARDRDAWIFSNSDLTVSEVRFAHDFEDIAPTIQEHIDSFECVTAYNKKFDFDFLRDRGIRIDQEFPCPMLAATDICQLPGRYGDYKWPKVEEAWAHFFPNEPYVELHRGLDDAMHEARIVLALIEMGAIEWEGAR